MNSSEAGNYQAEKASDAIISGGFFGKGIGEGTLNSKIPEAHTDYIVSVVSEEFGAIIVVLIILLYLVFAYKIIQKINLINHEKIKLILIGCVSLILLQTFVHIGVNIRLLPTTGMTLPYLSYGGSSIISTALISGIVLNLTKNVKSSLNERKCFNYHRWLYGHVIPAMILFDHLSNYTNVTISTDRRGSRFLDKDNYNYSLVDTPRLKNILFLPINLILILYLTLKSCFLLKNKKIGKLISTGGYMSLPLILAAKMLNLKIYLLEPNMVLGRSNKFFFEIL